MNTEEYTCDCGFKWLHGRSGVHQCEPGYRKIIADLRAALAAKEQREAVPFPPLPLPVTKPAVLGDMWDHVAMHLYAMKYADLCVAAPAAWDADATTRLRSIVDLLDLQSCVPEGDLTGYEFAVLGFVRAAIERLKATPPAAPVADAIVGKLISMDVSTGDDDFDYRVFGRVVEVMTKAGGADEDTILAIEESRNFGDAPLKNEPKPCKQCDDSVGYVCEKCAAPVADGGGAVAHQCEYQTHPSSGISLCKDCGQMERKLKVRHIGTPTPMEIDAAMSIIKAGLQSIREASNVSKAVGQYNSMEDAAISASGVKP